MDKRTCTIEGCYKPAAAVGLCHAHYYRLRKHGDPHRGGPVMAMYADPRDAMEARTEWDGDCLVWTGALKGNGYGVLGIRKRMVYAHRFAWELANGPVPDGMEVDHICFRKACVNVEHLRLANRSQNGSNAPGRRRNRVQDLPRNVREIRGRYYVSVMKGRKHHSGGAHATVEDAVAAAEALRLELFGEFAGRG